MKNQDEKDGLDFTFEELLENAINDEDSDSTFSAEMKDLPDIVQGKKMLDDSELDEIIELQDIIEEEKAVDVSGPDEPFDLRNNAEEEALDVSISDEIIELLDEEESAKKESGLEDEPSPALTAETDTVSEDDTSVAIKLDDEPEIELSEPGEEVLYLEPEDMESSWEGLEEIGLEDAFEFPPDELTEELSTAELIGISEERIEAIIIKAVRESVEKATRETVAGVAEEVIRESIEALKQSLEPTPK